MDTHDDDADDKLINVILIDEIGINENQYNIEYFQLIAPH